jgi:carboxypeptidase family protein
VSRDWGDWEVIRRQVALCGRVVRDNGSPLAEGTVSIEPSSTARPPLAHTRSDGIYFFLDLPGGEYNVAARDPGNRSTGEGRGSVSWDAEGNVRRAIVDIETAAAPRDGPPPTDARKDDIDEDAGLVITGKKQSHRRRTGALTRRDR